MNVVKNKIEEIEERIDKLNIGQFKSELMNQLQVNYRLQSLIKENYESIGNTRIGGWPDLPESIEYPTNGNSCLLYTSPSPRDRTRSRMPSSA